MAAGSSFRDKLTDVSWAFFFIAFILSLAAVDYEVILWLRTGKLVFTPCYALFNWLHVEPFTPVYSITLHGVQSMLLWLLGLPLALLSLIVTPVLGELFNSFFAPKNT